MLTSSSAQTPKIAVIVPIYNVENYVGDCLQSLLNQTFKNFTLIAIDDGSTDRSGQIAEDMAQQDSRLLVLHQKNGGLSVARNTGLDWIKTQSASFDYISFVDSDDVAAPDFLERFVDVALTSCADITVCGFYKFTDDGRRFDKAPGPAGTTILSREEFLKQLFSLPPWDRCCAGGMVWKCLYRARLIEDLRFPVDREVLEDEIFNTQAAARMTKAAYFPDALYGYRLRATSLVVNGRFAERVIRCRKLCAQTARTISEEAYRITCAAYTASVLSYYKNTPIDIRQTTFLVELPMADVKASLKAGFLSQKHWHSYRLMRCPTAFRLFLGARQLAHNFKERLRRLRGR